MKAVLVEPMKRPEIVEITASLEELQRIVGGKIEVLYPFEDEVGLICGDESKYDGSLPNRLLEDYDVIFGNFLICGLSATDFDSLSDEMAEKYAEKFASREMFFRRADKRIVMARLDTEEPMRVIA